MEKAFWGMIAGCALAFGVLLTMYLNKTGVIDLSPEAATEAVEVEATEPELTMDRDELYALVYGDEWTEEDIVPETESEEETEEEIIITQTEEVNKSGEVAADRNDDHEYFMTESEEPTSK